MGELAQNAETTPTLSPRDYFFSKSEACIFLVIDGNFTYAHTLARTTNHNPPPQHRITAWRMKQTYHKPIQPLTHNNLTPQATRLRQPKRQIQHIILIITRLLHLIKHLLLPHNNMTSRAGARASTRALHLQVVGLRDVEQVVAVGHFEGVRGAFFVDEGYVPFLAWFGWGQVAVGVGGGCCEGAEGWVGFAG